MKFYEMLKKLRKNADLSQEQLANQLNVSRQAVTKWESGLAMPDIDNLVELSKLFNISLNELLQVKEVQLKETDTPVLDYWRMFVENEQMHMKYHQKERRKLLVLLTVCFVLGSGIVVSFNKRMTDMSNRMENQYRTLMNELINRNHYPPIQDIANSLVETYEITPLSLSEDQKMIEYQIHAILKEYTDNTQVQFKFTNDALVSALCDASYNALKGYGCTISLPIDTDNFTVYMTADNDGSKQTSRIAEQYNVASDLLSTFDIHPLLTWRSRNGKESYQLSGKVSFDLRNANKQMVNEKQNYITSAKVIILHDSAIIKEIPLEAHLPPYEASQFEELRKYQTLTIQLDIDETFNFDGYDTYQMALQYTDSFALQSELMFFHIEYNRQTKELQMWDYGMEFFKH